MVCDDSTRSRWESLWLTWREQVSETSFIVEWLMNGLMNRWFKLWFVTEALNWCCDVPTDFVLVYNIVSRVPRQEGNLCVACFTSCHFIIMLLTFSFCVCRCVVSECWDTAALQDEDTSIYCNAWFINKLFTTRPYFFIVCLKVW